MKLRPPTPSIDKNKPFDGALFGREEFANSLTRLLQNTTDSPVVFVHAPWGGGKTFFARRWQASLEKAQIKTIYFDAYSADYADDPFVSFTGEIVRLVGELFPQVEAIAKEKADFTKAAVQVGKRALGLGAKIALAALTRNAVEWADLKSLTAEKERVADGLADIGADLLQQKIDDYAEGHKAVVEFQTKLQAIAAAVKAQQNFPLTIIVDELDRCRPDFALGLLERIKHLFEVENVAFVLFVNQEQLENSIRHRFGIVGDQARTYLQKFATITVDLPSERNGQTHGVGLRNYCQMLADHFDLSVQGMSPWDLGDLLGVLAGHFDLTLRDAEKAVSVFALYLGASGQFQYTMVALLAVLKIKHPSLYSRLCAGAVDLDQFAKETRLSVLMGKGDTADCIGNLFRCCLLSDAQIQALPEKEKPPRMERLGFRPREKLIPSLCADLDKFRIV